MKRSIRLAGLWLWPLPLIFVAIGFVAIGWWLTRQPTAKTPTRMSPKTLQSEVSIDQKLNTSLPLDIRLTDERGRSIELRTLLDGKPILLTPVYYQCPMLCNMVMDSQVRGMSELSLDAGQDYTAVTFSFDPRETPALAAAAKRTALRRYGRPGAERGWRFLTGEESEIQRLTDSIGFHYKFDPQTNQYAHAAALVVLTPEGKISRYLYGVDFRPRDLRLALVEASGGRVGSVNDQVLLLCYHYDPTTGRYGLAIMNAIRVTGLLTVLGLGTGIVWMIRNDKSRLRNVPPPNALRWRPRSKQFGLRRPPFTVAPAPEE